MDFLFTYPAESEGFEPPIRAIRIPHFECGSFDHSDNFPTYREHVCSEAILKSERKGTAFF